MAENRIEQMEKDNEQHNAVKLFLDGIENREEFDTTDLRTTSKLPEDTTEKGIYSDIFKIAWPSFVELLLTQLVSMVDMIMVGSLGNYAISAVGLSTQPKMLLMAAIMSMNIGTMALVARYKGRGDREKAKLVLRQAAMVSFSMMFVIAIFGFIFCREIIDFIMISKTSTIDASTLNEAVNYFKVQIIGMPVIALTNAITSALRGIGSTKIAMIYNLTSNLVNVFFNYCLINGRFGFPKLGVLGASIATVIGQTVAMLIALIVITRKRQYLRFRIADGMKPDFAVIGSIWKIGFPAMIEQLAMRLGNILYTRTIVSLGTDAYAAHQICFNLQSLTFMIGQAFSTPATSLIGQSIGKRRLDVADAYGARIKRLGLIASAAVGVVFFFFGKTLASLYSEDISIINICGQILRVLSPLIIFQTSQLIDAGILRGAGDTRFTANVVLVTTIVVRAGLAYVFVNMMHWGLLGAWFGFMIDQMLRSLIIGARYRSGKWKHRAMERI